MSVRKALNQFGGNIVGDPPVLIPNTEVKPHRADGTCPETDRESRSLPNTTKKTPRVFPGAFFYVFNSVWDSLPATPPQAGIVGSAALGTPCGESRSVEPTVYDATTLFVLLP